MNLTVNIQVVRMRIADSVHLPLVRKNIYSEPHAVIKLKMKWLGFGLLLRNDLTVKMAMKKVEVKIF